MACVERGSERVLVGSKDFKSFCRALDTSGVGSIPTRSRQFAARVLLLFLVAVPGLGARAGAREADSLVAPPVAERNVRAEKRGPAIWWVTVRSGILPGWGQLANRKPLKTVLFSGAYAGFAVSAFLAESDRRSLQDRIDLGAATETGLVEELNGAVNRRNFGMWMMGATMIFSMLDAYVDAHFFNYDDQWRAGPVFEEGLASVSIGYRF